MAEQRFPRARIVRQLDKLAQELSDWQADYAAAAETTQAEWLQGRFMDREAILGEAYRLTEELRRFLFQLPRLS